MNISNKSSQSVRKAHLDAEPGLSSLVNEVLSADTRAKIAANMTPEEIQTLLGTARLYESGTKPYNWPNTPDKVIGDMADAVEQLQIEAAHWREAYYDERAKYLNLISNK
jgi:hypothetical protein